MLSAKRRIKKTGLGDVGAARAEGAGLFFKVITQFFKCLDMFLFFHFTAGISSTPVNPKRKIGIAPFVLSGYAL